jgi:hypothetical protein
MTRYGIIGVFNEREHGKTTFMVKHVVSEVNTGINYDEAFTNIHVGPLIEKKTGFHYGHPKIHFIDYAGIIALKQPTRNGVPRALLALDQAPNYIDSRASNSLLNRQFSKFVRESRQHGVDLIYTNWMRSEVDRRLRPFTELIVGAYKTPKGFLYKRVLRETGRILPPVRMPWRQAEATWQWFDSSELINDPTIPVSGP